MIAAKVNGVDLEIPDDCEIVHEGGTISVRKRASAVIASATAAVGKPKTPLLVGPYKALVGNVRLRKQVLELAKEEGELTMRLATTRLLPKGAAHSARAFLANIVRDMETEGLLLCLSTNRRKQEHSRWRAT